MRQRPPIRNLQHHSCQPPVVVPQSPAPLLGNARIERERIAQHVQRQCLTGVVADGHGGRVLIRRRADSSSESASVIAVDHEAGGLDGAGGAARAEEARGEEGGRK